MYIHPLVVVLWWMCVESGEGREVPSMGILIAVRGLIKVSSSGREKSRARESEEGKDLSRDVDLTLRKDSNSIIKFFDFIFEVILLTDSFLSLNNERETRQFGENFRLVFL